MTPALAEVVRNINIATGRICKVMGYALRVMR